MARVTPRMGLRVWDQGTDNYDHAQQANNWARVDYHDHTPGRGVLIPSGGIAPGAITTIHLSEEIALSAILPPGIVLPFGGPSPQQVPGSTAPPGYVFADGKLYDGTLSTYARLWSAIQTYYGGTGISSFAVPNLCKTDVVASEGRFPLGVRTGLALGVSGGADAVTLTGAQSGVNPNGTTNNTGGHSHTFQGRKDSIADDGSSPFPPGIDAPVFHNYTGLTATFWPVDSQGAHAHTLNSRGADASHENMPPYQALNYIIKL